MNQYFNLVIFMFVLLVGCSGASETAVSPPTAPSSPPLHQSTPNAEPPADQLPIPQPTSTLPLRHTPTSTPTATPAPPSVERDGWLLYENDSYGYRISYPPEATVSARGATATGAPEGLPDEICVVIHLSPVVLIIEPPAEPDGRFAEPCGLPLADYPSLPLRISDLQIDGTPTELREYTNWEKEGETISSPRVMAFINLPDGNLLQFIGHGSLTRESYDEIRPVFLEMIASYRPLAE